MNRNRGDVAGRRVRTQRQTYFDATQLRSDPTLSAHQVLSVVAYQTATHLYVTHVGYTRTRKDRIAGFSVCLVGSIA